MRLHTLIVCLMLVLTITCLSAMAQNPIQTENALAGTTAWQIASGSEALNHQIEGYASKTSVNVGEPITFYVSVDTLQRFNIEIYRLGWYNGDGGRLLATKWSIQARHQTLAEADHNTGLTENNWSLWGQTAAYTWTPPAGTVSGAFVAKLVSQSGFQSYIPFVVRDDSRPSDFLFQTAVTTYQAYNLYPYDLGANDWRSGKSLYSGLSFGPVVPETADPTSGIQDQQARAVSFNRPYFPDNNNIYNTAGYFFQWEYNMVRWIEKEGYDVTYQTDVDTHTRPANLEPGKHKVLLSVGHDEYWSWQMRDSITQARDRGDRPLSLGFFGANVSHWQIRFASSSATSAPASAPNRTMIAYKQHACDKFGYADPFLLDADMTNDYLTSVRWREIQGISTQCPEIQGVGTQCPSGIPNCYKPPEDELVGVMTDLDNPEGHGDFQFDTLSPSWIKSGMTNPNQGFTSLLGYEADRVFNIANYPDRSWSRISDSLFVGALTESRSHAVYYKMTSSGARVFGAGTVQWAWGVDPWVPAGLNGPVHPVIYNSDVEVVTRNVLACLRDGGVACGEN